MHYEQSIPECVVCLQLCHHPVKLPCNHIFCFLCIKGVAARSHRCALCRAELPDSYFENPIVVEAKEAEVAACIAPKETNDKAATYKWFYEGRNGWWQYEVRASDQLEQAFQEGKQSTEIIIAGFAYIVDIENMVQYRKNYPTRRRRIKRDKAQADKKGIAGLKYGNENQNCIQESQGTLDQKEQASNDSSNSDGDVTSVAEKLEKTL